MVIMVVIVVTVVVVVVVFTVRAALSKHAVKQGMPLNKSKKEAVVKRERAMRRDEL